MLEKPDIPDQLIISQVQAEYGLEVTQLTFLPLGYDVNTAVYRVDTTDGTTYFLKLRKDGFHPITVIVPQFLHRIGIPAIIPPLTTQKGELFGMLEDYTAILYPFTPGKDGYQVELSDRHWIELGRTFKMVHTAQIPRLLAKVIPREVYDPQWRESVKRFQAQVEREAFTDPIAEKLSNFMKGKEDEISHMVSRATELANSLQQSPVDFVLCHTDAHPGNYLITDGGELYLVDWDNPTFAPKERDLMCFGSGMSGFQPGGREEALFYQGYGPVKVDRKALTYYRYERIIQDIAEFCKQILLTTTGGEDRELAFKYFVNSFSPNEVVDVAFRTDQLSGGR